MIRPELKLWARQWREALTGSGLAALGVYGFAAYRAPLSWIALAALALGCGLILTGLPRGRLRAMAAQGPGIVETTEGQIAYFGPEGGGVVALDTLQSLTLDPSGAVPVWKLGRIGEPVMHIPVTAKGAENLLDSFATLPNLHMSQLSAALSAQNQGPKLLWQRAPSTWLG
ncbi:MAG: hypothetical protein ACPGNV_06120 [Mangrovicoccus sp.]